jgi:hypothetical protein
MVDVVEKSSIIDEEEKRASQGVTGRVSPMGALAALLVILIVPALLRPDALAKLPFDQRLLADVDAVGPDYMFIGNSMLETRMDLKVLDDRLGDRCCFILWTGGAESAWTHQALKNIALAARHRPKAVFIFFRDTYLTQPSFRSTDRYWWKIERLSHDDEPELTRALMLSRRWQERLEDRLAAVYPVQKARDRANSAVSWIASEVVTPGRVSYGASAGQKYDGLFALDKLRNVEADDTAFGEEDLSKFDFQARVDSSLLPSMIRMAKDHGVNLVFVRVQRRPTLAGPPSQRPELQAYIRHLRDFVTNNGAQFYDFTGDPELTLDHYNDGDHIKASWKAESTDLFLRRLRQDFQ